jgi:capsid protein
MSYRYSISGEPDRGDFALSIGRRMKAATNILFNGSRVDSSSKSRPTVLQDTQKALTPQQWKNLAALGRALYTQLGEVRGAIGEKAMYTVGSSWFPQFYGKDKVWGDGAETWLWEWMKICDVRGEPYDLRTGIEIASIAIDRCGDVGTVFTETPDGYPMIQWIPAHRIGSRGGDGPILTGPYTGLAIWNGVISNAQGRPVAYRVLGDANDGSQDRDISARDMMLSFDPDWHDQGRGLTSFYHAIVTLMHVQDVHGFQMDGIKAAATKFVLEYNDDGEADTASNHLTAGTNDLGTGITIEQLDGGIQYMKSNSGGKIEFPKDDRPSPNTSEFLERVIRSAYQGIKWPYEFTRDPKGLTGNSGRVILAKAFRTVQKRQILLERMTSRIQGYAISKAIKLKILKPNEEWWKFCSQKPKAITGDWGREAQQNREDVKAGLRSVKKDMGEEGDDWLEERDQIELEAKDMIARANRLVAETGVTFDTAMNLLQMRTPNGNVVSNLETDIQPTNTP